ncbi:MAG TPA: hypothetical protein VFP78_08115 [Solirubrobacteraceae bacterium]|nr:hypothetical protein [Solirubrobacteraceae bacterium]
MSIIPTRGRLALVALLAAAAIGSASPASAQTPADCDVRLERLEAQFYEMEARRGYEAASEWWQPRWHAYFQSCVIH